MENVSVRDTPKTLPADATLEIEKLTGKEAEDLVPSGLQVKLGSDIYEITTTGSREFWGQHHHHSHRFRS